MKKIIWIRILRIAAALLGLIAALCLLSAFISARMLIVTHYELNAPLQSPLRLVQLSDLHNRSFGNENQRLIERVCELEPDFIFLTGDMINEDEEDVEPLLRLVAELNEIAPVYFSYGNHEKQWEKTFGKNLRVFLDGKCAAVLDTEYVDIDVNGDALRIGGYANYYRQPHMLTKDKDQIAAERQFADDFESTERYKILLSHIPTSWLDWEQMNRYPVDLVFCGHYHGGLIRFPGGQGLVAPYVGFFPPFTKGLFEGETAAVVLSTGLGSPPQRPRMNNPGEIVCLDLLPEQ